MGRARIAPEILEHACTGNGGVFNLRCVRKKLPTNAHTVRSLLCFFTSVWDWNLSTAESCKALLRYLLRRPLPNFPSSVGLTYTLPCMSCPLCCLARFDRPRPLPQYDFVSLAI